MQMVKPGRAFGLGLWSLDVIPLLAAKGFDVTAVDQNELSLEILQSIVEQEGI